MKISLLIFFTTNLLFFSGLTNAEQNGNISGGTRVYKSRHGTLDISKLESQIVQYYGDGLPVGLRPVSVDLVRPPTRSDIAALSIVKGDYVIQLTFAHKLKVTCILTAPHRCFWGNTCANRDPFMTIYNCEPAVESPPGFYYLEDVVVSRKK